MIVLYVCFKVENICKSSCTHFTRKWYVCFELCFYFYSSFYWITCFKNKFTFFINGFYVWLKVTYLGKHLFTLKTSNIRFSDSTTSISKVIACSMPQSESSSSEIKLSLNIFNSISVWLLFYKKPYFVERLITTILLVFFDQIWANAKLKFAQWSLISL